MELVSLPRIIFLDEPTSGLDSKTARDVVRHLKRVALDLNVIVICTIHQPSSYLLRSFDRLSLLSPTGRQIYFGGVEECASFFEENFGYQLGLEMNPAEFYIDSSYHLVADESKWSASMHESDKTYVLAKQQYEGITNWGGSNAALVPFLYKFITQLWFLCKKDVFVQLFRNPSPFWFRLFEYLLVAVMFGSIFIGGDIPDRINLMYVMSAVLVWLPLACVPLFHNEQAIISKEGKSHYYSAGALVFADTLVALLFLTLKSVCFCVITYFMVGMQVNQNVANFFFYFISTTIFLWTTDSIYKFFSLTLPSVIVAMAQCALFIGTFVVTAGFYVRRALIPGWYIWVHWANPIKYYFEGLMTNQFGSGIAGNCTIINTTAGCSCLFPDLNGNCMTEGIEILGEFGIIDAYSWPYMAVVFGFGVLFRICFYLALELTLF